MKNKVVIFFLLIYSNLLIGQIKNSSPITIGKELNLYSKILKEDRTILVHDPNQGLNIKDQKDRPVVYVLDGYDHFRFLVGLLHRMGGDYLPKMIIVGITQNDRNKDLWVDGYDNFSSYIEKEVIPYIDTNYKTTNNQILIGHSLGGLFTMTTFLKKNNLFSHYLIIDPYLIDQKTSEKYLDFYNSTTLSNKSMYLSIAKTFPKSMSFAEAKIDTTDSTKMVREIVTLVNTIETNTNGLKFKYDYFDDEEHMSAPNISIYKGLRFFFISYKK